MSGSAAEPVVALAADADGVLRRLVAAVDAVVRADLPRHALVGGLAVMVNLAQAHRVTADVDTVSDDDHGGIVRACDHAQSLAESIMERRSS